MPVSYDKKIETLEFLNNQLTEAQKNNDTNKIEAISARILIEMMMPEA